MKQLSEIELINQIKRSRVWNITFMSLSLFCSLIFFLLMWTFAAFGAVMFAIFSIIFEISEQTSIIRLEMRK